MNALTHDQIALLQRAKEGKSLWGGDVRLAGLQGDVELLLALRFIEPDGTSRYTLTALGAKVLGEATARPSN